jgi:methylenetetrahydrofolate dehydrogenase (NADP+)/methenyltetrahydrofolate cyclohydrolase
MAKIISGTAIAEEMRAEIAAESAVFATTYGIKPGLAVVIVGEDPASQAYVRMKGKAAEQASFFSQQFTLAADTSEEDLLALVNKLNHDDRVHGILVQLPLPKQIDSAKVLNAIDPAKDVDGFHPVNVGRLGVGDPHVLAPCTPAGVIEMLVRSGVETKGANAVVVGRSNIVGKPAALLLLRDARGGNATVTVAHSRTKDLPAVTRQADILVVAIGKPNFITKDMVKPGAVVIDVGVNRVDDAASSKGYKLVGDVAFDEVEPIAGAISPVPGGVGPMTITMLMRNTLDAARSQVDARRTKTAAKTAAV